MAAIYICENCKYAGIDPCCEQAQFQYMGPKWRLPKRSNKKAWRRIASGEIWWDRKAVAKKAIQQAEYTRRILNNIKRKRK